MLKGTLQGAIAFGVAIAIVYPLTREMAVRGAVEHELLSELSVNDAAALQQWPGTAQSFVNMLRQRCFLAHGESAPACQRYRTLSN